MEEVRRLESLLPSARLGRNGEDAYLELMKRCLVNWIYPEGEILRMRPLSPHQTSAWIRFRRGIEVWLARRGVFFSRKNPVDLEARLEGGDWPQFGHSMVGMRRLDHLQGCCQTVLREGIPGDFVETGVWRGGASILMAAILRLSQETQRKLFVCDSFQGLPVPNPKAYPEDQGDEHHHWGEYLGVSLEDVKRNFQRYGLLSEQVEFVPGWFSETLDGLKTSKIAVLRLDGDMYESTWDALEALYPRLQPGGFLIVDDYFALANCRKAVEDFFARESEPPRFQPIDAAGAWMQRG